MAGAGLAQQTQQGLKTAGQGTMQGMKYQPMNVQAGHVGAGQVANTNLSPYMNPYTDQVINTSLADLNRAGQMALNNVGAQATGAGAFGGSRHGIAEAETNRAMLDQAGQLSAGLRSQGFNTALNTAGQDIDRRMQAGMANQQAGLQAGMANQQAGLQGNAQRLGAASQMGNLANLGFGWGQQINDQQFRQGTYAQGMQQQLIDAVRGQYGGFTGAPGQSLSYPLAALGAAPNQQTQTTTQKPGLLNILSLGLGLL